ncbi:MAG: HDIG domain-containing protein [Candidatus Portnoybacteria bacterium]|nr:HDIG domain-containing protein [Candidatus Portnoybacteria bacterium]
MNREQALQLVKEKIQNKNLIKHCLAVEICMKELAEHFNEDKQEWALAGLLHDIDYEETKDDPEKHSIIGSQELKEKGLSKEICEAVKTHNEMHGIEPQTKMGKALLCVDPMTGLIVASTLVLPSKKIQDLTTENILNRYKENSFARGANREIIAKCSDIGLSLEEFSEKCLKAMQSISDDLGL